MRECSDVEKIADVPNSGIELLEDMKDRLALEGSELQRMEYEGGLPLKPSQKIQVNACLKASQRIKTLLLTIPKKNAPRRHNPRNNKKDTIAN